MEQQRTLLYLTLVFFGFMIWTTWQQQHAPKPPVTTPTTVENSADVTTSNPATTGATTDVPDSAAPSAVTHDAPVTATIAPQTGGGSIITITTDTLIAEINTKGGTIEQVSLPTYPISLEEKTTPVIILDRKKQYSAQSGLGHKRIDGKKRPDLAPSHHAIFSVAKKHWKLEQGSDKLVVPLTWTNNGITVTKRFTFNRGKFNVDVEQEVNNQSGAPWSGFAYHELRHGPAEEQTGGIFGGVRAYIGPAFYDYDKEDDNYSYEKFDFGDIADSNEPLNKSIKGGWTAMLEHYFVSAWVPPQEQTSTFYKHFTPHAKNPIHGLGYKTALVNVATGTNHTFKDTFYVGPKLQDNLEALATGLDLTVDYGIFSVISKPIFWLLDLIHSVLGNWGWAIIFVTITIKLIFFYPSAISYRSMAKMKKLAPRMKEMQSRYQNDPQAKQKAMMDFYRKEKINPLGGCLPMLIQIPVFMGLYWVLLESVELRQAPWLAWYEDLSIMDPFFILPLLMGGSMWFQQKLNPPQMDPMQQKIFAWLPVVFTVMFLFFPAGLVLYWLVNNLLSIAQQWFINKKIIGDQA
ncbi:MAG: membrane protein insertase YidC [Thiotrichaceae bacterium]|nr:membrane protein insertase YidC [Thiotrichaceae bacterium]